MYTDLSLAELGEISKGRWDAASRAAKKATKAANKQAKREARRAQNRGPINRFRNAVNEDIQNNVRNVEETVNRTSRTTPKEFIDSAAQSAQENGPRFRNEAWKYGGVAAGITGGVGTAAAVPVIATREHKANLERRQARFAQQQGVKLPSLAERRRRAG